MNPIGTITLLTGTGSTLDGLAIPSSTALVGNPITVNFTVQGASGAGSPTGIVVITV